MNIQEWSNSDKKIARRAYEAGRQAVLAKTLARFKAEAAAAESVDEMWDIVARMRERGKDLEHMLDSRYSMRNLVLARLVAEGHLDEHELEGLSADRLEMIRRDIQYLRNR